MKKKVVYTIFIIFCILILSTSLNTKKKVVPNTYYQVYLDGELMGMIKSKDKFDNYINEQGNLIKNQVIDYQKKMEIINSSFNFLNHDFGEDLNNKIIELKNYQNILEILKSNIDEEKEIIDIDEINNINSLEIPFKIEKNQLKNLDEIETYLNENIKNLSKEIFKNIDSNLLNEVEKYYLDKYLENKYYDIDYSKIIYMKNFIQEYGIYEYADNVYSPLGISIKRINTYSNKIISEKNMYKKIIDLKPCTIEGYQFRIKRQDSQEINSNVLFASLGTTSYKDVKDYVSNDLIIYTTDKQVFDDAVETFIEVFVGEENYLKYKNGEQEEIVDTGTTIENIYIEQDITVKETNISVKEKIYTDAADLSSFLLYGDDFNVRTEIASASDTISSFAHKNQISVEEFFLFNREFTSINNMFYEGQEITIAKLDTQMNLVIEEHSVVDMETNYTVVEKYNSDLTVGSRIVTQQGENGIDRVNQNVVKINGSISYIEPISKETIKGSTNEVVEIGTKTIAYVGSTGSWGWPTNPGYTFSSYFGYRPSVFGEGDYHSGLDIAGLPYGSPVYAANNGTIVIQTTTYSYGNYIMIDHHNGFYTLYAHMDSFAPNVSQGSVVARGQVIGYIGQSGWATGPHLHYEIRVCERYSCITDPLGYY